MHKSVGSIWELRTEQFHNLGRCVCDIGLFNGKTGAEAVVVYATQSQHASQHLQLFCLIKLCTCATKSCDKIAGMTSV